MKIKNVIIFVVIAILVGVVLTIVSGLPPLSILLDWVYENGGRGIWLGVQAAIIAFCCSSYIRHVQKRNKNNPEEGQKAE